LFTYNEQEWWSLVNIKAWSFSRLSLYESCPYRAKLQYIDKIPEPERPLPAGKTEHANERGSRIHEAAEHYLSLQRDDLLEELLNFKHEFEHLRNLAEEDQSRVQCEGLWCFDDTWESVNPDDYNNVWLRVIIDSLVWLSPTEVVVIDFKTGKRYGNEIKHGQQMTLYALAVAMKYPEVEVIHTELWYLDLNELAYQRYLKDQALAFLKSFNMRALTLNEDTEFKAKPNKSSCMFCPYGGAENKWVVPTGDCDVGV
jgi:RecB family exonuclease